MNFNFFFKKANNTEENKQKKKETTIHEFNEEENKQIEKQNIPLVKFNDTKLQLKIGEWTGILNSKKLSQLSYLNNYPYLDVEELIKKTNILEDTTDLLNNISKEFGKILKELGVDKDEICTIDYHNIDDFSFNCHFEKANKDAKISLKWDDIDHDPRISIEDNNKKEEYYYGRAYNNKPSKLYFKNYTLYRENNSLFRYLTESFASFRLNENNYSLSLEVSRPKGNKDSVYKLNNEEELQEYLLNLSFPIDISDVYKHISEIALGPINEYPYIQIEVKNNIDKKNSITTDYIYIKNGQLTNFIITKNEKKISIDKDDNWSFTTEKVSINKTNNGKIDYRLNLDSHEELIRDIGIDRFTPANEEVNKVKQLTKNLFDTKKQSS